MIEYAIGTVFKKSLGKSFRICTVVDIWKTYNSKGELVKIRYVATHDLNGQTMTDNDVLTTTIAKGVL